MRALRALAPALLTLAAACGGDNEAPGTTTSGGGGGGGGGDAGPPGPPWLVAPRVLVSGQSAESAECRSEICRHNENTDLVAWQGALWLVHRTATSQVLGPNSSLRVSRSTDGGASFELTAVIPAPVDRDLRDPHFYLVGDHLQIKALTRLPGLGPSAIADTVAVSTGSSDGVTWSDFTPIMPPTWSPWRVQEHGGTYYSAAYRDGDLGVSLFTSADGASWTEGAALGVAAEDRPSEAELTFLPSGKLLALVRMDGTEDEVLGYTGRLRTQVCWADPPYASFSCPQTLEGQRLDGPLSFFHEGRLFVVARKHLGEDGRKRTALFEIQGDLKGGGELTIHEHGELPSAGDTSYAGQVSIDQDRVLVTWYAGSLEDDDDWLIGMIQPTDVWQAIIDFSRL